ncbi:MAG TPA: ABC transporter substrate-binding protein [Myxococcaceae bacterium]|nr:ABC transporter substrate-binding protein [Myxococcaceae bacterium]
MSFRPIRCVLLPLLCVLGLGACERKPEVDDPSRRAARERSLEDGILLGVVGALTGDQASFGVSTRNGILLAVKEENEAGGINGHPIRIRAYDSQGKPPEGANAVTRLINQDGAALILGEVASGISLAMAPVAQAAGVPMISPSSTNPKVTEVGDYIFRVCFIDPFQGDVMARFAHDNLKAKRVAVLRDIKSDYSVGLVGVFKESFTALGGTIVADEAYSQGDTDFRSQLTAIKASNPDAVYVPGYYTEVGILARQAKQLGLRVPLMGGDGWESSKLYELGGSALDGNFFSNHYSPEDPRPIVKDFIAKYAKEFGMEPDSLAVLAYDAAKVAIEAIRRAGTLSGPALRDAIAQTRDFPGVGGTITLDEHRNARKKAVILRIEDRAAHFYTSVEP